MSSKAGKKEKKADKIKGADKVKKSQKKKKKGFKVSPQFRYEMITTIAHHRAAERDFALGHEINDWLWAERVVDDLLSKQTG